MEKEKPTTLDDYKKWFKDQFSCGIEVRLNNQHESISGKIKQKFSDSPFWQELVEKLSSYNQTYFLKTNYNLVSSEKKPELLLKPFESFVLKTFRKNIINNKNWPNPPDEGWLEPGSWYSKVNDTVRTSIVTKYLDGVEFLVNEITTLASTHKLKTSVDFEAKDDGYYAAHCYVWFDCEVPTEDWETKTINVPIEIQITTQLQEVIKTLLHKYYEHKRGEPEERDVKWQWKYRSDEFSANYLGHILHYVEGMIMEVRDKQSKGD